MQQTLFSISPQRPDGFLLKLDFPGAEEEHELITFIRTLHFGEVRMHGVVAKRRIVHFGLRYAFTSHHLSPAPEIPAEFRPIQARAAQLAGIEPAAFSEVLVTEYSPGAGIGWHRDAPPFGIIAGVSLASPCRMRFQRGTPERRESTFVELPPRSVYLLTANARNEWQHSIPAMKELRYSITFRTLKEKPDPS